MAPCRAAAGHPLCAAARRAKAAAWEASGSWSAPADGSIANNHVHAKYSACTTQYITSHHITSPVLEHMPYVRDGTSHIVHQMHVLGWYFVRMYCYDFRRPIRTLRGRCGGVSRRNTGRFQVSQSYWQLALAVGMSSWCSCRCEMTDITSACC
jgi:hypothetical protein